MNKLNFRRAPNTGRNVCMREGCTNQAAWHVWMGRDKDGGRCTLVCGEHKDEPPSVQRHWVTNNCNMPGSRWFNDGCRP